MALTMRGTFWSMHSASSCALEMAKCPKRSRGLGNASCSITTNASKHKLSRQALPDYSVELIPNARHSILTSCFVYQLQPPYVTINGLCNSSMKAARQRQLSVPASHKKWPHPQREKATATTRQC